MTKTDDQPPFLIPLKLASICLAVLWHINEELCLLEQAARAMAVKSISSFLMNISS